MPHGPHSPYLILCDIDGTLVRMTDHLPGTLFEDMVRELFGRSISLRDFSFAGRTDRGIIREIADLAGIPDVERTAKEQEIMEWIARELEPRISTDSLRLLPGVRELLDALQTKPTTTLAVLTGNMPAAAEIKLRPYDLERYFAFGVYGIESEDRNDLGPIALERAIEFLGGVPLDNENVVVIGDSVRDVECAKAIGARTIITLTGNTTLEMVEPLKPEFILNDLSNTEAVLRAIYDVTGSHEAV